MGRIQCVYITIIEVALVHSGQCPRLKLNHLIIRKKPHGLVASINKNNNSNKHHAQNLSVLVYIVEYKRQDLCKLIWMRVGTCLLG